MTVKEYAAANHVSEQSVYAKINRNSKNLIGHILKQNGKTLLDTKAQEILKPTEGNYQLAKKANSLEKSLNKKREYGDYMDSKCKNLQEQLSERDRRIERNVRAGTLREKCGDRRKSKAYFRAYRQGCYQREF